jgi:CBS domain-containing protein
MPTVQDVLLTKGSTVYSTDPQASVLEAVQKMNQHKLGALVVMDGEQVVGIFTERDVLMRVVGEGRNPRSTSVGMVMTNEVICVPPETDIEEVSAIMQQQRIRHLPVCGDNGQLYGMISIGDVNAYYASHQEARLSFLNDYIFGRS